MSNSGRFEKGHVPWTKGKKGLIPWNKGKKGVQPSTRKGLKMTEEQKKRMNLKGLEFGHRLGEKHHNWKGDEAGYRSIHNWIENRMGTPRCCDECGTTEGKRFHWHNIDGKYKRNILDWKRLCPNCHSKDHVERRKKCV